MKQSIYFWQGKNEQGQKMNGEIQAFNPIFAKVMLKHKGIYEVKLKKKIFILNFILHPPLRKKDIHYFVHQLSILIKANIALIQALSLMENHAKKLNLQLLIKSLITELSEGKSLAKALGNFPQYFNPLFCSLIEISEQAGALAETLIKIVKHQEKIEKIKSKIFKALVYPSVVLFVALVVSFLLMLNVVPTFKNLFGDFNANLPWFTELFIQISQFLQNYYGTILIGFGFLVFVFIYLRKKSEIFNYGIDRILITLPVIGNILKSVSIARYCQTLGLALSSGIPLVPALDAVSKVAKHKIFIKATLKISLEVSKGLNLHDAMQKTKIFPDMLLDMIKIAEEVSALDEMLIKIGDQLEQKIESQILNFGNIAEPLIMVILSLLVGSIVIAMYLPIFKLGQVI